MIKFIIAKGIGFSPGSQKYIPTHGFVSTTTPVVTVDTIRLLTLMGVGF